MYNGPARGGTRGGRDQFSWEDVKNDKNKEFYLGHSLETTNKPTFNNPRPNSLWWKDRIAQPSLNRVAEPRDNLKAELRAGRVSL
jgi:Multiple myeloma tumor-associated